jgi:AcrR family transcriptional regulator
MARDAYHHGDLKSALIEAALKAVEQGGSEAVSLRELAQQLGVSRAAPYRHFADRDALLAEVAARGFEDLVAQYEAALAEPGEGLQVLRRTRRVYLDFAERRPGLFRLMFESDLLSREHPPAVLIPPADRAYHLLWETLRRTYPQADERTIKARAITSWSTIYGFIALRRAGRFKDFMTRPLTSDEVEAAVLDASTHFPEP